MPAAAREIVTSAGLRLASEAFGAPGDPALVLVMGATASMLGWPDALCETLAAQNRFVLRFDHRDTGCSTTTPPGPPGYAVEDMARDVLAVMDGWSIASADVMGMSLGGYIAQVVALIDPGRVRSLILFASEPLGWDGLDLPGIAPAFLDHFGSLATLDWTNTAAVAAMMLETARLCAANPADFDAAAERAVIDRVLSRTSSPQSAFNHASVGLSGDWAGAARRIACPTLVLHGEIDPILPLPHGEALASAIPGARLHVLRGTGHALPDRVLPGMASLIDDFLSRPAALRGSSL